MSAKDLPEWESRSVRQESAPTTQDSRSDDARWIDAATVAALLAVDPCGTGGVVVRASAGPLRDHWIKLVRDSLPPAAPFRRVPVSIDDSRFLGGLDLVATLRTGTPVAEQGMLAAAHDGIVVLAMAERQSAAMVARLAAVLDTGERLLERDGLTLRTPVRIGVIALDEGIAEDERPSAALLDRLAFHLDLEGIRAVDTDLCLHGHDAIAEARQRLPHVRADEEAMLALCTGAWSLGIASLRAPLLALRAARAAAALDRREFVSREDLALAARLVLGPRATTVAAPPPAEDTDRSPPPHDDAESRHDPAPADSSRTERDPEVPQPPLEDIVLQAAHAALPARLLAELGASASGKTPSRSSGRAGTLRPGKLRGRPTGVTRGDPRNGARIAIVATLCAAAPWQRLRRAEASAPFAAESFRVEIRPEDFRVRRFKERRETTAIFAVDASGSSALHRLAEAKGAVELLLAQCYVRRDRVAVIAFRGRGAELLLPPTRSLVRAKRSLAGLPGGGGTPLASAIDAAAAVADSVLRRGGTPLVVLLTDGSANVARNGEPGRSRGQSDALEAACRLRGRGIAALVVDTSPRPQPGAARLADEMRARYLALPYADAATLSRTVHAIVQ